MSGTMLTTIIIVLSEILLVLLILGIYLYRRSSKRKAIEARKKPAQAEVAEKTAAGPSALDYLEEEIRRTSARLEEIEGSEEAATQTSLTTRLNLLGAERQLLEALSADDENTDYWGSVNRCYESDEEGEYKEDYTDKKNAIYLARIKNLENFKTMFMNSQEQLKDSFDTINKLKEALGNLSSDEAAQLEEMVDKLSIDNINSNKQLNEANQQLQSVMEELEGLRSADSEPAQTEEVAATDQSSPLDYIETEIQRTSTRLDEIDGAQDPQAQASLTARLNLLGAEKQLLESLPTTNDDKDLWPIINKYYSTGTDATDVTVAEQVTDSRDAVYLARIKNLENFKSMFIDSQDQLQTSFETISNLKDAIGNMSSSDEAAQLEDMVDKLSVDNFNLNKQLNGATLQLQNMVGEMDTLRTKLNETDPSLEQLSTDMIEEMSVENMELTKQLNDARQQLQTMLGAKPQAGDTGTLEQQIQTLKEENEFLTSQVENLLAQEAENSELLKAQMLQPGVAAKENETGASTGESTAPEIDELTTKLQTLQKENESLQSRITQLSKQDVEGSNQLREQIDSLKTALMEKEKELEVLSQSSTAPGNDDQELSNKMQTIEEENKFLCEQIQLLLQQELESSNLMKAQMENLKSALEEKEQECNTLKET